MQDLVQQMHNAMIAQQERMAQLERQIQQNVVGGGIRPDRLFGDVVKSLQAVAEGFSNISGKETDTKDSIEIEVSPSPHPLFR